VNKAFVYIPGSLCLVALFFLLVQLDRSVKQVSAQTVKTLDDVSSNTKKLAQSVEDLKQMTNAALYQIGDASHEVAETAREQKKYWDATGKQTVLAMQNLNKVLIQLQVTAKDVDSSQIQIADSASKSLVEIQNTLQSTQKTLEASTKTVESMDRVISDPAIAQTLAHVNQTSANIQDTSKSVSELVARLSKPKGFFKSLVTLILDAGSKISTIVK
jgi:uncharacterized protein YoxC